MVENSEETPKGLPASLAGFEDQASFSIIGVPTGARLRVEIASASFPRFSRNLNTGGHNETETNYVTAQQTIYHDLQRPSCILLPIIPEE